MRLRRFLASDAEAMRGLLDDAEAQQWNPITTDLETWVASQNEDGDFLSWAITSCDDDRPLGAVSLTKIDRRQGTGHLGYRVLPDERGRGVATAGSLLAARHGFEVIGLRRIELFHALANPASCVVAERAGFLLEGTLRAAYVYGDGVAHDEHLHARLAADPTPDPLP